MSRPSRERFREIDAIFDAALDLASYERDAFIAQRCGDDIGLRAEVQALLGAHARSGDFLEAPAVEIGAALLEEPSPADQQLAPMRAGPFASCGRSVAAVWASSTSRLVPERSSSNASPSR